MTQAAPASGVLALTAHARNVGVVEREKTARDLRESLPRGSILLVTCHRVEAYAAGSADDAQTRFAGVAPVGGRVHVGPDAARHLVSVAVGRDSVVAGEDEILHQLRETLERTRREGAVDPVLDRLFTIALRAGRRARSWQQGRPRRSLADLAIDVLEARGGRLARKPVVIVGAGKMGGLAARAAVRAGATVTIANRSIDRAHVLAEAVGGQATGIDPGPRIATTAAVIVAVGGPWSIDDRTSDALVAGDAIVVDLSFPPAISTGLGTRLGSRMVTADQLAVGEPVPNATDREPVDRLDALIDRSVVEFGDWLARGDSRAAAAALVRRADLERERQLEALWRRIPELDPEARAAIERMTRHLAARLLQEPLERLGSDSDGREGRNVRELFAL